MRPSLPAFAALLAIGGCSAGTTSAPSSGSAIADLDLGAQRAAAPSPAEPATPPAAPAPAPAPAVAPAPAPAPPPPPGLDFLADARLLFRVAACGDAEAPVPPELGGGDAKSAAAVGKIVERHCKVILDQIQKFRAAYFERHRPWFEKVVPKDHKTVVYPFGGGDLLSALVAFPDATEITTISLEQAGDPRRLRKLKPWQIETSLGALRAEIGGLISVGSNTSENLSKQQRNELPGQVSSFLLGLVAGGYEPLAMRYFTIDDAGELKYFEQADLDALDAKRPKKLKHDWESPNFSEAFQNVEIRYRRPGEDTVRVHRHVGWNLGDDYLKKNPQLLRHLEKKGKVVLLTKGASYLLWRADFSLIRNYMLGHLTWMLSDSTGIPPFHARKAGMVQETYGSFNGAFLEGAQGGVTEEQFLELWRKNPRRALGFRFGYVDKDGAGHLVVTRPRP
ncbi:MAG TPA: hypothetical protein VK932_05175 [Kofleriaceae bacterium]|nr:hypothetical protein [Kofleriaceae bacterium]